jgi:hypothetical protein
MTASATPTQVKQLPNIAVVGIDINKIADAKNEYKSLSAEKKILLIQDAIISICEDLKKQELTGKLQPNSMWIIGWREYGITEADSKFVTSKTKAFLKETMNNLVDKYKQLNIIAGTVASKRRVSKQLFLASYETIKNRIKDYQEKGLHSLVDNSHIDRVKDLATEAGVDLVRNTCFVFPKKVRSKAIGHFETLDYKEDTPNTTMAFYPGKEANFTLELKHPNQKDIVKIGIEICFEHLNGALRRIHKKPVDIHFILSDHVKLNIEHANGSNTIFLDSKEPLMYLTNQDLDNLSLSFYRFDLLNSLRTKLVPIENLAATHYVDLGLWTPEAILSYKSRYNILNENGFTLLGTAVLYKKYDIIELLLTNGANPNIYATDFIPVNFAIQMKQWKIVNLLIQHGADLMIADIKGETGLDKLNNYIKMNQDTALQEFPILYKKITELNSRTKKDSKVDPSTTSPLSTTASLWNAKKPPESSEGKPSKDDISPPTKTNNTP